MISFLSESRRFAADLIWSPTHAWWRWKFCWSETMQNFSGRRCSWKLFGLESSEQRRLPDSQRVIVLLSGTRSNSRSETVELTMLLRWSEEFVLDELLWRKAFQSGLCWQRSSDSAGRRGSRRINPLRSTRLSLAEFLIRTNFYKICVIDILTAGV